MEQTLTEEEKIDRLMDMQGHCGTAGIFLTGLWLYLIHNEQTVVEIEFSSETWSFFILLIIGFFLPVHPIRFFARKAINSKNISVARNWLRTSSVICIALISILIWASGGPNSPFIVFYTMTFTLTLSQVKADNFELMTFFAFLLPLIVAFWLSYESSFRGDLAPDAIMPIETMKILITQLFHFMMVAFGAALSLAIPTFSLMRVRSKKHGNKNDSENRNGANK